MLTDRRSPFDTVHATAQEEAYQHIKRGIRMGELRPGTRLTPDGIAAEIGTSRMPVREALNRLATEGLIVNRPNRGAVVRVLTAKEVREVFAMRSVLEGLAASLAAENVTANDIEDLERLLQRMDRSGLDASEWITAHSQFHERLSIIADAPQLMRQIAALHSVCEPLMRVWLEGRPSPDYVHDRHDELISALKARDGQTVESLMRAHILRTLPGILQANQNG
ncbi:GntR family transcriptional regulator [Comamonas endophytica]|uniref:GntR family transcriptional regulator n=1 Tax=Comamonas endophytica TaxID=2949090 RepID=A0ABY6G7Q4_9BURK|nr:MULTISPECIES: GntR family transcriptional regulator [unclassified Acidovorax]MCD2514496.1 GntR family transcriptional regulator [Acidovorax sp. D4N7]UYG51076.1 GntR family transcriptional regulator [Acidovorax sp. 5MLIR]